MNIRFKHNKKIDEVLVTIEKNQQDEEVERLLSYFSDYEQYTNILRIEKDGQVFKIPYLDILWVEVIGDYTSIYTKNNHLNIRKTLQSIEADLPFKLFIRVSRNTLVNIREIKNVENSFSGTMSATLMNNQTIHISRRYWKNIKKRILDDD